MRMGGYRFAFTHYCQGVVYECADPKVADLGLSAQCEQDVGRLNVAMHLAGNPARSVDSSQLSLLTTYLLVKFVQT